jgi:predicted GH43/DUF377 family glycosyl hydrolase
VDELPREAIGVRGACSRFRTAPRLTTAPASWTHSKRFAQFGRGIAALLVFAAVLASGAQPPPGGTRVVESSEPVSPYKDGRPTTKYRLNATDQGVVLRHGDGPGRCDYLGARDVWVFEEGGTYYMHYDAAGATGWLAALATSKDLVHWEKKGPALELGKPGEEDAKSASYGVTFKEGRTWHMYYLGTPNVTPAPDRVPMFPYQTMKARSQSPAGPWTKEKDVVPFRCQPGTYYSVTASPGYIVKHGGEYLMFFSAAAAPPIKRTISIARTKNLDGPWRLDPQPIVSPEEQVENTSLYYEPSSETWFLFTNHIGVDDRGEYTDAVWVYWSHDLNQWDARNKAVVLDRQNCAWSKSCIGLPSVVKFGKRLAVFYDAPGDDSVSHTRRDVGLAWLDLPLVTPARP